MRLFEWKQDATSESKYGIQIKDGNVTCDENYVEGITFRGYPKLELAEIRLVNCACENCGSIQVDDGFLLNCTFDHIDTLFVTRSDIVRSTFQNLQCDNHLIVSMEDCAMTQCVIRDVELRNEAYFCEGVNDVEIRHCKIQNCRTDRLDRELFHGIQLSKRLFGMREKDCQIVDRLTCSGFDQVQNLD